MFKLKVEGTDIVLADFYAYRSSIKNKADEFCERLCEIGADSADIHFNENWSLYIGNDGEIDIKVEKIADGYAVVAHGERIAFIEFGAGVHYNGAESYLGTRPPGIVGIGEYGDGRGKQDWWVFRDDAKNKHWTQGNPPANALYYAGLDMEQSITRIAKEVFG